MTKDSRTTSRVSRNWVRFVRSCALMLLAIACHTLPAASAQNTDSAPLYVDSKAIKDRFPTITAEDMEMLRSKKIILASRSFGLNTCNGLNALAKQDKKYDIMSSFQRFDVNKAGGDVNIIPPDIFNNVHFLHFLASMWPLSKRVDEVEQLLRNSPHNFGKTVDAVIIYYHTCTPEAFDAYSKKMDAMQADFPNIKFIYVCSGLSGPKYAEMNEKSHAFSEKVRERYKGKVPIYDMEKILSDDFRAGHFYCPEYSKDPAELHPNEALGEMMMAKGFLLVLRDAFRAQPGKATPVIPASSPSSSPTPAAVSAAPKAETLPSNHPDVKAVRAILDMNGLTKKTVEGSAVVKGGRIVELYLQECGVTILPPAIGKLDALRVLHLYGDRKLPHPFLKVIAPEIGQCMNLEVLLLAQNDLQTLPVEITKLQKLKNLAIGDNKLKNLAPEVVEWAKRFDPKGLALQK